MGKSKAEEMDFWTGEEFRRFIDSVMNKRLSYDPNAIEAYQEVIMEDSKPFILWQLYFPKVFKENGGFDIVIGNPPYLGFHNVPDKDYFKDNYFTANGKYDFYVLFIEQGLRLLAHKGILSFICPSYFYKRNYGKNVRKLLLEKTNLRYIADFADYQIFDTALTYTCIFGAQKGKEKDEPIKIIGDKLDESTAYYLKQEDLQEPSWNLEKAEDNSILNKILEKSELKFGDITKSISQGIVTGFNDIYLMSEETIQSNRLEKCYMWVHRSGELYKERPIVIYEYQKGREHHIPLEFYRDYKGVLVTDGLSQYHLVDKKLPDVTNANCWAHARRDYADAVKAADKTGTAGGNTYC